MAGCGLDLPGLEYRQVAAGTFGCNNEISGFYGIYKIS